MGFAGFLVTVAEHHLAIMLITVLAVLPLTITTTIVSGNDCECEYNNALNDFHGDQQCFSAYYEIQQNWGNDTFDDTTAYRDTLCNGSCGAALNSILYYQDHVTFDSRQVSTCTTLLQ